MINEDLTVYIKSIDLYNPLHQSNKIPIQETSKIQVLQKSSNEKSFKSSYLFKKGSSNLRTFWNRRYFELKNDSLTYTSETKTLEKTTIDLRICMVRTISNIDRKYCFEILSPSKSFILQAESEFEMNDWVSLIQGAITRALQSTPPRDTPMIEESVGNVKTVTVLSLVDVNGNSKCADCESTESVEWASCNLGSLLCINCSGAHRGLGRSVSKIRSLELDRWDQSTFEFMKCLGNTLSNQVFEERLDNQKKPSSKSSQYFLLI